MEHVASQVLFDAVLINGTGNAESVVIDLQVGPVQAPYPLMIALQALSASGAAPDVKLQYAVSEDGTNFSAYADHANVISSTLIERVNNIEGWNQYPLEGLSTKYVKFKVTGIVGNHTDTRVSAKVLMRECL